MIQWKFGQIVANCLAESKLAAIFLLSTATFSHRHLESCQGSKTPCSILLGSAPQTLRLAPNLKFVDLKISRPHETSSSCCQGRLNFKHISPETSQNTEIHFPENWLKKGKNRLVNLIKMVDTK